MAKNFNVDIEPEFARKIKEDWREANPKVVKLWYDIERAAAAAVGEPGRVFACSRGRLMFKVSGRWLYMRLPSGRKLAYLDPQLNADGQVTYMGVDTYTRQWQRVKTYGGKLLQNACEGIARDLLVAGLLDLESVGYPPIGSVHDEGILEVPTDFGSLDEAKTIITRPRKWATGLPVGVEGWRGPRYGKR